MLYLVLRVESRHLLRRKGANRRKLGSGRQQDDAGDDDQEFDKREPDIAG